MPAAVAHNTHQHPESFSHEVLFYSGTGEFAARMAPFVREGVAAGEPVLVMVTADKIELLRAELGPDAEGVTFVDMGETGRNPGRIISAWSDFAAGHLAERRRLRGIGEPIWAGRDSDEMVECQLHESLLNQAFGHADGFRLLCPYDVEALPPDVIDEARRSHPLILEGGRLRECSGYHCAAATAPPKDTLPAPRVASEEMGFQQTTLATVRRFVGSRAADAGLSDRQKDDIVLAVSEAATNSVRHGGGQGVVRIWQDAGSLVCEVRDRGRIEEPLVGRVRPEPGSDGGHGLWMANQLCDLVQIRTRRNGTVVRLHMRAPARAREPGPVEAQPPTRA
jgi:anti-sigma regulatory factor (Ser/Thr protein kinase)